jgi:hypothetical protein
MRRRRVQHQTSCSDREKKGNMLVAGSLAACMSLGRWLSAPFFSLRIGGIVTYKRVISRVVNFVWSYRWQMATHKHLRLVECLLMLSLTSFSYSELTSHHHNKHSYVYKPQTKKLTT